MMTTLFLESINLYHEPHPRIENIEESLRAEIRDPLWMLSRQWQLGAFQGEGAGKATSIKLSYQKYLPQGVINRTNFFLNFSEYLGNFLHFFVTMK